MRDRAGIDFPCFLALRGGEGEIRTPEALASLPVFKTGAFNRSATSPFKSEQPVAVILAVCWRCFGRRLPACELFWWVD
jgi:hypothetical protein